MDWNSVFSKLKVDCSISKKDLLAHSYDSSLIFNQPLAVFYPKNLEELIRIVEFCYDENIGITPKGAGTSLTGSSVPSKNSVVLNLCGLNKILYFNQDEKEISVQPGVIIDDLNNFLKQNDLYFPVVPSSNSVCTVGGCVSTNALGLHGVKFGSMENWVKEIVFIDGKGKLRKETSKNFCGSEGTLGICVEAKLKLTSPIKEVSGFVYFFDSFDECLEKIIEIKDNFIYLELLDKKSASLLGLNKKYYLISCFENNEYESLNKIKPFLRKRKNIYPILAKNGYFLIEDPMVSLNKIDKLVIWLEEKEIPFFGHIGCGILHPCFSKEQKNLIDELYSHVLEIKGKITGEHGYGIKKNKYVPHKVKNKILELKKKYDPKGIMNPGKLIGSFTDYQYLEIKNCIGCGLCKRCPIYLVSLKETDSPRFKMLFDFNDLESVYKCTLCKLCDIKCPVSVDPSKNILEKRGELVRSGCETKNNRKMREKIKKCGNPFGNDVDSEEFYCC